MAEYVINEEVLQKLEEGIFKSTDLKRDLPSLLKSFKEKTLDPMKDRKMVVAVLEQVCDGTPDVNLREKFRTLIQLLGDNSLKDTLDILTRI